MTGLLQHGHRRWAAWLGVVALLVQAWLPLIHHPATLFAPDGEETAAFAALAGKHPALCLAAAQTEEQQAPTDRHAPAHPTSICPICRVLHAVGGVTPPDSVIDAPEAIAFHVYVLAPPAFGPIAPFEPRAQPRAPPLPV